MSKVDVMRRAVRFASHLYQLTTNGAERVSLASFILKYGLARVAPSTVKQDDTPLYLRGAKYFVGVKTTEIFTFDELFFHHEYDKVPGFIPERGWTVLDVGANVGIYACEQARRGAHVYAFEPNPACYRRLSCMVAENNLGDSIRTFNCALGCAPGAGRMVVPRDWTTSGSVVPIGGVTANDASTVAIDSLDHIVPSLGVTDIDLLKIDVEGAELDVLRGATQTLALVQRLVVEYHSYDLLQGVRETLGRCGFSQMLQINGDPQAGVGILYAQRH